MKTPALLLVFALGCPFPALRAADEKGSRDHPALKRVTGSEIIWSKVAKFDEMTVPLEKVVFDYDTQAFKPIRHETAAGEHTTLYYKLPADVSPLEASRQYEQELKTAGFELLFTAENDALDNGYNRFVTQIFPAATKADQLKYLHEFNHEEQRYTALKGTGKTGNPLYVSIYAFVIQTDSDTGYSNLKAAHPFAKGDTIARVDLVEAKAMDARMTVVKAEEIEKSLVATGRMAIYGVYFDTDKAEIKPESAPALAEMAKAILGGGADARKVLIAGHTDNQGDFAYNQSLSLKRASAVTAALATRYAVPAARMIAVGVGMAAPVAPNTDEAGRAKNRRVEIVAM